MKSQAKVSVYEVITNTIVDLIGKGGVLPWQKPWGNAVGCEAANYRTKHEYRGINASLAYMAMHVNGWSTPYYLTYKQAQELGGNVKKGSKSLPIVYWIFLEKEEKTKSGDIIKRKIPLVRYYNVFNLDQIEGIEFKLPQTSGANSPIESAEAIVSAWKDRPATSFGGDSAFYSPSVDRVRLPEMDNFKCAEEFYSVLFHEYTHATGHSSRLARPEVTKCQPFGSQDYGKEELVAEFGAAFLCGKAGIENKTINNSAAYLNSWMRTIKANPKLLIEAAGAAQKAVDLILGKTRQDQEDEV